MSSNNANEMVKAIRDAQKQIERDSESTAVQNDIIGANLIRLYQNKCYKEMPDVQGNSYKSFETFCKETFGFSRIYAYRLMDAHKTLERLKTLELTTINQPERVLTMLKQAKLDDDRLKEVWDKATRKKTDAIPSRNAVREAIGKKEAKKKNTKDTKIFDELFSLDLTASEKKALNAIIKKWNAAHEETAEVADAADE